MAQYRHIEESFQKIRLQTNNSDVREIVQKFMTKEQTYSSLLVAVNENEQKYDQLKALNDQKRKQMQDLSVTSENRRQVERPPAGDEQANFAYEQ